MPISRYLPLGGAPYVIHWLPMPGDQVSSSNFPQYDRNLNNGQEVGVGTLASRVTATQTVYHDAARPSRLLLPVIPR